MSSIIAKSQNEMEDQVIECLVKEEKNLKDVVKNSQNEMEDQVIECLVKEDKSKEDNLINEAVFEVKEAIET